MLSSGEWRWQRGVASGCDGGRCSQRVVWWVGESDEGCGLCEVEDTKRCVGCVDTDLECGVSRCICWNAGLP